MIHIGDHMNETDPGSEVADPEQHSERIELVLSPRPEDDSWTPPTYHEMLDHLCKELKVPGSPNFWEAVQYIKERYRI